MRQHRQIGRSRRIRHILAAVEGEQGDRACLSMKSISGLADRQGILNLRFDKERSSNSSQQLSILGFPIRREHTIA